MTRLVSPTSVCDWTRPVWLENGRRSIRYLTATGDPDPKRPGVADHLLADEEHLATVHLADHTATVQKIKRQELLSPVVAYREYVEPLWAETSIDSDAKGKLYVQIQKRRPDGTYVRQFEVLVANMKWERSVVLPGHVGAPPQARRDLRLAVNPDFVRHCRAMSHDEPPSSDPPPNSTLAGKVALVTGAARGIGRAYAIALAQAGAVVFLASPAASLINGSTLLIDGGWTAQ